MNDLSPEIKSVSQILQLEKLSIPLYQRPYKWTIKNVVQLLDDIFANYNKTSYRLGTIVIHKDSEDHGTLNIVDGQQRTITLLLIAKSIIKLFIHEKVNSREILNPTLKKQIETISLFSPSFKNQTSINNIRINYSEIERRVASWNEEVIDFFFNKCEFVKFTLTDITEAFQFFDSQNARGKDLEPHDLLKAFHLREFSVEDNSFKQSVVKSWESMQAKELKSVFGKYLFRIIGWSKGISARYFSKNETDFFKGININSIDKFPYTESIRIAHYYVDNFNNSYERKVEKDSRNFPFQIDQTIINGRRFFEMISYYKSEIDSYNSNHSKNRIISCLNTYQGKNRTGDKYIRMMFDCAVIYYLDKFGMRNYESIIEKLFIWAYKLRLRHQAVQLASVDNYVLDEINIFQVIKNATVPEDVVNIHISPIDLIRSTKTEDIEEIFQDLRYYNG